MRRTLQITILTGLVSVFVSAARAQQIPEGMYHIDFTDEQLNQVADLFPQSGPNPAFLNSDADPNLHLLERSAVTVTFLDEGAGYRNKFGYFVYDENHNILRQDVIFPNASERRGGGRLRPGDALDLGEFDAGTHLGFWLQADGYRNPNGPTYYTLDEVNPDGQRHMAIASDTVNGFSVLGIEDLWNLGDRDYNDVVIGFRAVPVASGTPEPGETVTAFICLTAYLAHRSRMKRRS